MTTYTTYDIVLLQRIADSANKLLVVYPGNPLDSRSGYHMIESGYLSGVPGNDPATESFILTVTDAGFALLAQLTAEAKRRNPRWTAIDWVYHNEAIQEGLDEQILRESAYNAGYTDGIAAVSLANDEIDAINEAFSKIDAGPVALAVMERFNEVRRRAEEGESDDQQL